MNPTRLTGVGLLLVSAGTLTFEINLTRLFSVAQFYHFAFMVVSIALFGFGASGTALTLFSRQDPLRVSMRLPWLALGCGASMLFSYLLTNWVPFDSFSVAWDLRQVAVLVLHYLALATPFFFCGMAVGILLANYPERSGNTYALNLTGSAIGCLAALVSPHFFGGEGTVSLSFVTAMLSTLIWIFVHRSYRDMVIVNTPTKIKGKHLYELISIPIQATLSLSLLIFGCSDLWGRLSRGSGSPLMALRISPYKSLSYALQYPGAEIVSQEWNSYSRVDVVRSTGIRSLPGLSYRYLNPPPQQDGLLVDGDDLVPILQEGANLAFASYMPAALAYELQPEAKVLILEPRGGLDVLIALANGAHEIKAVEPNSLIIDAADHIYRNQHVELEIDTGRSYLKRTSESFDVIQISLTASYHPVRSGAYSLAEDFRYTEEAFKDALERLKPGGLLIVTRWLQNPPSEFLRVFALGVTALEHLGYQSEADLIALRGYNIGILFVKKGEFSKEELFIARNFAKARAFDFVHAPGLEAEDANQFNVLAVDEYYNTFKGVLETHPREDFYRQYPFEVTPPEDEHPFFGHFFKWSQVRQVLTEFGKTWQPFGGAGYLVILALLILSLFLAGIIVVIPALARGSRARTGKLDIQGVGMLTYFGLIGLAFLLVEIPLIQSFILYLGQPAYAFTMVLFSLLLFSGLGSQNSERIPIHYSLIVLVAIILVFPWLIAVITKVGLGLPLPLRLILSVTLLAPAGFMMGTAFPSGIKLLVNTGKSALVPWVWGVNGASSVVAAILAALMAITFGFGWVLRFGALSYAAAWLAIMVVSKIDPLKHPHQ